jgi:hypothetical protein
MNKERTDYYLHNTKTGHLSLYRTHTAAREAAQLLIAGCEDAGEDASGIQWGRLQPEQRAIEVLDIAALRRVLLEMHSEDAEFIDGHIDTKLRMACLSFKKLNGCPSSSNIRLPKAYHLIDVLDDER